MSLSYSTPVLGADGKTYHKYVFESFVDVEKFFEVHILGTTIRSKVIGTTIYTSEEIEI